MNIQGGAQQQSDNNNNNNSNSNKSEKAMDTSEGNKPKAAVDNFKNYFTELSKQLKQEKLGDLSVLLQLLRSQETYCKIPPANVFYLTKVIEFISLLIIDNVDKELIHSFSKSSLDFCLNSLERWCDSERNIGNNNNSNNNNNNTTTTTTTTFKSLNQIYLLSVIDMLCCIEYPSTDFDKSALDDIPSFLDLDIPFVTADNESKLTSVSDSSKQTKSDSVETNTSTTTTATTSTTDNSTNIFDQFLNNGLKNDQWLLEKQKQQTDSVLKTPANAATDSLKSSNKNNKLTSGSDDSDDEEDESSSDSNNEELAKICSNHFKSIHGPSRLIAICSGLLLPYTDKLEVQEKFEHIKEREYSYANFIGNVLDIMFSREFDFMDNTAIAWMIDFLGTLIGTIRSYQSHHLKQQITLIKGTLFTTQIFENIFTFLSGKSQHPDLKAKAEVFFSLCVLTDIEKMNVKLDDLIASKRDSLMQDPAAVASSVHFCWSPQLVILALDLVFAHLDNASTLQDTQWSAVVGSDITAASLTSTLLNREPTTKFVVSSSSEKQSINFDFFLSRSSSSAQKTATAEFTNQELCNRFIAPRLLDSVFTILYISCFKLKDQHAHLPPSNNTDNNNNTNQLTSPSKQQATSTSSTTVNKVTSPNKSYGEEDSLFGVLFEPDSESDSSDAEEESSSLNSSSDHHNILLQTPGASSLSVSQQYLSSVGLSKDDDTELSFFNFINDLFTTTTSPSTSSNSFIHLLKHSLTINHLQVLSELLFMQSPFVTIAKGVVGPFPKEALSNVATIIPREQMTWLGWIFVKRQAAAAANQNQNNSLAFALWEDFLNRVKSTCSNTTNNNENDQFKEVFAIEYIIFLLFSFHTLDLQHRTEIVKQSYTHIQQVIQRNKESKFIPNSLIFSRLIMILNSPSTQLSNIFFDCILTPNPKNNVIQQEVHNSIITRNYKYLVDQQPIITTYKKPDLYEFNFTPASQSSKNSWLQSSNLDTVSLFFEQQCSIPYEEFYNTVCFGLSALEPPTFTSAMESMYYDYIISSSCLLISSLPPSKSFQQSLKDKSLFDHIDCKSIVYVSYLQSLLTTHSTNPLVQEIPWIAHVKNIIGGLSKSVSDDSSTLRSNVRFHSLVQVSLSFLANVFEKQENVKMDSEYFEGWDTLFDPDVGENDDEVEKMETDKVNSAASQLPTLGLASIAAASITHLIPQLYECLIDLLQFFKREHKTALTKQLSHESKNHIELIKECFSFSNKPDVLNLMERLGFVKSDRDVVDRWTKEIRVDASNLSKVHDDTFGWLIHPYRPTDYQPVKSASQTLDVISTQQIITSISELAFIATSNECKLPKAASLKLELSYEHMYLNIDQMLSFMKESKYLDLSTNQLAFLINLSKLQSFEKIVRLIATLPAEIKKGSALESIIVLHLDAIILVAKSYPNHLYCHYISSKNAMPMGEQFTVTLPLGDISAFFWLTLNNQNPTINRKALSTLIQLMTIPIPPDYTTSLRSHAISAFTSIPADDLKLWFEQKLLGTIVVNNTEDNDAVSSSSSSSVAIDADSMVIDNNDKKSLSVTPSSVQIQEYVVRLIGLITGNKDFANFSLNATDKNNEDKNSDDEDSSSSNDKKSKKKAKKPNVYGKKTPPVSPVLSSTIVDWEEKVSDFAPSLFNYLLSSLGSAFNQWIDYPHLLRGYFGLLQYIAIKQNQLVLLFAEVSRLNSPSLVKPTSEQIESLDIILEFIESFLEIFKSEVPSPKCSHHHHHKDGVAIDPMITEDHDSLMEDEEEDDDLLDEDREWKQSSYGQNDASSTSAASPASDVGIFGNATGENEEDKESKLASKLCTYTATKSEYMEQHWYFCYTCNLKLSEGCCSVCVKVCHKGHAVSYSRFSRFFCDCGAGAGKGGACKALKPRAYQPPKTDKLSVPKLPDLLPSLVSAAPSSAAAAASTSDKEVSFFAPYVTQQDKEKLLAGIGEYSDIITRISALYPQLIQLYKSTSKPTVDVAANPVYNIFPSGGETVTKSTKEMVAKTDLFSMKKTTKYNSFEAKLKYEGTEGNQMKNHIGSGHIQRRAITSNSRGVVALAEGENVSIINLSKILDDDSTVDKTAIKVLSKSSVQYPVVSMVFNPLNERYLAVVGYKECKILTVNQKDEIVDQLVVDLSLYSLGENIYIIKVEWVVGSQTEIAVVTNEFIKIYNLAQDNLSPIHFYTLVEDYIRDMTIVRRNNTNYIVALAESGMLYFQAIQDSIDDESCIMIETIQVPTQKQSSGVTVFNAPDLDMLICTYTNGEVHALQFDDNMSVTSTFPIQDPNLKIAMPSMNFIQLSPNHSNIFSCLSARGGFLLTMKILANEIQMQSVKLTPKVEGMTWVNKASPKLLVLLEDGSLSRYDYSIETPLTAPTAASKSQSVETKESGIDILSLLKKSKKPTTSTAATLSTVSTASSKTSENPVFPIDFFEKVECITPQVKFGGDPLMCYSQDLIKQRLANNDEYIACQNLDSLSLIAYNNDPDVVICGIRVLLGHASLKHIPTELRVFDRVITTTESLRRWYDIPLTKEESLKSSKKLTLIASSAYNLGNAPIIDSVEIYAISKETIGWDESAEHKSTQSVESQNPTESVLLHSMNLLKYYFSVASPQQAGQLTQFQQLPAIMTDPQLLFLQPSVKSLLKMIHPSHEEYITLKYSTLLQYASDSITKMMKLAAPRSPMLSSSNGALNAGDVESLDHIIKILKKISCNQPAKLTQNILSNRPSFLSDLLSVYLSATNSGVSNTLTNEQVVSNLTHLLWNCLRSKSFPTSSMFELIKKLLSHPSEAVRTRASLSLCALITKSSGNSSIPVNNATGHSNADDKQQSSSTQFIDEVLFSCDKCSTSPILNKRWHCDVCADFDLCDNCYQEIKQGDLHPSDHKFTEYLLDEPMKIDEPTAAATTTAETTTGVVSSSNEHQQQQQPSSDYDEDLQRAIAMSLDAPQETTTTATPDKMETESTAAEDATLFLFKYVLDEINQLYEKGFNTVLPYFQVLKSLFIHLNNKLVSSSHMDHFINLVVQYLSKNTATLGKYLTHKSLALESDTMVILLLAVLLDTEEHKQMKLKDPSKPSSSSPITASSTTSAPILSHQIIFKISEMLVKKGFVGILQTWLQQLFEVISKQQFAQDGNNSPFGALLVANSQDDQSLSKNRFYPFFSKSLPQSLNTFHQIIAKSIFKIAITFYRCDRRKKKIDNNSNSSNSNNNNIVDEKPMFVVSEWDSLVCSYIHSKKTASFVKYPKKLLLLLSQTKSSYYSIRDEYLLRNKFTKIQNLESQSNGFTGDIHYDHLIKLINYLSNVLVVLFNNLFTLPEESSSLILELLTYAFVTEKVDPKKDQSKVESSTSEKEVAMDVEMASDNSAFITKIIPIFLQDNLLDTLINKLLLEPNALDLRTNTSNFLYYLWKSCNDEQKIFINRVLWTKLDKVVSYGKNSNEFMELLTYFINEIDSNKWKDQYNEFADKFVKSFKTQNNVICNHPNSQIYNSLGTILELDGYYLESEPCLVCNNPEVQYQTYRLDTLKQEVKFTESAQLIKFNGVYSIQKLTINISDIKKARMIKTINLYYNNKIISDIGELKGKFQQWKKLKQIHFTPNQNEKTVKFQIPIAATNFMIEYFDFHDNLQALASEKLQCPRCSRTVTDKHGLCKHCHENAYQCKQCRNINYDHLEAFLCNECGYSKHARFDYSFTCKPTVSVEKIENQDDYARAVATIDKESENAHKKYQRLTGFKKIIANLITSFQTQEAWPKEEMFANMTAAAAASSQAAAAPAQSSAAASGSASQANNFISLKINRKIGYLAKLYEKECKSIFEGLSKSVQILLSTRMEILKYMNSLSKKPRSKDTMMRETSNCFGCSNSFAEQSLAFLNHLSRNPALVDLRNLLIAKGLTKELFKNNIHQGKSDSRNNARLAISYLTKNNADATVQLNQWIRNKIDYVIENCSSLDLPTMISSHMMLVKEYSHLTDSLWQTRFRFIMEIFFKAIDVGSDSPVISEFIILPCLKIILSLCTLDSQAKAAQKDQDNTENQKLLQLKFERLKSRKNPALGSLETANKATEILPGAHPSSATSSATVRAAISTSSDSSSLSYFDSADPNVKYDEWLNSDSFESWSQKYQPSIFLSNSTDEQPTLVDHSQSSSSDNKEMNRREVRARFLATKYVGKWKSILNAKKLKAGITLPTSPLEGLFEDSWVKKLLFNSTSSIRIETINLMNILSRSSPARTLRFLDLFEKMIPHAAQVGEYSAEFFALFNKITQSDERKIYLTVRGFLPYICDLMINQIDRIYSMESSFNTDVSQGFVLKTLVSILESFVQVPSIKLKMKRDNIIDKVLDAFLSLRGIIIQKNKLTEDSVKQLQDIMKALNSESNEDNKKFIAANIKALSKHVNNGRTPIFIFEQISNIVCPLKPEPIYQMILTKASTQEDYIRGSMNKNPYPSNVVGPLMRDVKNKICKTLDLGSFLDDDNGMELLVDNKIIKLDLPIKKVYEQVWKRSAQAQRAANVNIPMNVVYRLQGLDGEATEEIIENLSDNTNEERDPEEEFEITSVMKECGGLDAMLNIIERINDFSTEKELAQLVIKLLYHCIKIQVNRQQLLSLNGVSRLLEKLKQAFPQPDLAESLLLITESIVSEANRTYLSNSNSDVTALAQQKNSKEAQEQMTLFLDKLTSPLVRSNAKLIQAMTRVIPFLTYGHVEVIQSLVEFFEPSLQFEALDEKKLSKDSQVITNMDYFTKIADSTRPDENGYKLRTFILERGITESLYTYLDTHFAEDKDKSSKEWIDSLEKPALPYVLVLLKGLANGHEPTQTMAIEKNILKRVHLMEQTTTGAKIGTLAENLLEALKEDNPKVTAVINEIRKESRNEKMKQAEKHREGVLKELGLSQQGKHITATFVPGSIEELEDEEGFTCMVCREGYSFKPEDVLGIYTYSKKIPLLPINETTVSSTTGTPSGVSYGFSTVTHFNIIHYFCHRDATKADKSMKVPKEEWEGAALRNQQTKCNNIFPIQGPMITNDAFTPYCDKYWSNINNISRIDGPKFRLLAHDLKLLLVRFAKDESFSQDSKGGGKESNIRIIPFFIQFGSFLLDQKVVGGSSSANQLRRPHFDKLFTQFIANTVDTVATTSTQSDNVPYYLVLTLYLHTYKEWRTNRFNLLSKLIAYSFTETLSTPVTANMATPTSTAPLFNALRPWLLFFTLIDKIQDIVKTQDLLLTNLNSHLSSNYTKIQSEFKSLLTTFEECKYYEDENEFFDDLGLLKDILDNHKTTSEYTALKSCELCEADLENNQRHKKEGSTLVFSKSSESKPLTLNPQAYCTVTTCKESKSRKLKNRILGGPQNATGVRYYGCLYVVTTMICHL
ncbi:hypothetical protein PPL_04293 [Heterostelium album PN500]|uniref:UBR-type domain-containing protein n=1 Tax=Heterostelium pallidum (strain ATCC 26659 / Pp 5 / PN500) TaxID=670386 RepID=D3B758_HETP5|nr:hypothetical protein PPL_04293 [Heterostelium album PN500]EFA82601.1 hypothetical protein PPL_04293 [Heterostelium album PN500]|eukprot:XP_020434718.1 hypothetical protein PPL_04293 [Heterostelium album PN500]